MISSERERKALLIALIGIVVYMLPLLVLGEDAHIRVHDNLDSNLAWYKVLSESGQLFGTIDATIPQILNGQLQRNAFGTEFSGIVWLHHLFPTMIAYTISQLFTRLFAFWGMYLLLRDYFIQNPNDMFIRVGVALTFALTPFWPSGMLSTLGMPLALWAFLNLRASQKVKKSYVTITLLPIYSSFVLGFFFFLFSMGILFLYDLLWKKMYHKLFFLGLLYMTALYLAVEYRLVSSFVLAGEPNSRNEYVHAHLTFLGALKLSIKNYVLGHTHVLTIHGLIILPVTIVALIAVWKIRKEAKCFIFLMCLNVCLSIWYAFWFYKGWLPLTERWHFMNSFNFARFHFLRPMIIYITFAQALMIIKHHLQKKGFVFALLSAQLFILFLCNDEVIYQKKPSVRQFYAVQQFNEIKQFIGKNENEYQVVSVGIHPAIAQYNGLYTLDTYNNFYPLAYKHQFRKIIEQELEKNNTIKKYFDQWGGRCYVFTAELGKHYMFSKSSSRKIKKLTLNTEALRNMGGDYILSALPIVHPEKNQLRLEKVFETKSSAWRIYLYSLKENQKKEDKL